MVPNLEGTQAEDREQYKTSVPPLPYNVNVGMHECGWQRDPKHKPMATCNKASSSNLSPSNELKGEHAAAAKPWTF